MRNALIFFCVLLCCSTSGFAQRRCGIAAEKAALIAKDATWAPRIEKQRASLQIVAGNYRQQKDNGSAARTTSVSAIPVIFHIIVTNTQLAQMGGTDGIMARLNSQIDVINEDFNKSNPDGSLIPSGWTSLYGNAGIHFALAHTAPDGWGTWGFELKVLPGASGGFSKGFDLSCSGAKHASSGGFDAWDNTKYLNVWCVNFSDDTGLLGITVPQSFTIGSGAISASEVGIAINFLALGRRSSSSDVYVPTGWLTDYYDKGRTLTHELGHFFEIWHTWGDDGDACSFSGGRDDGLDDTPPEGGPHFYDYPPTIPGGTYNDTCKLNGLVNTQPFGIASLDFMNYTDDIAMHLFTSDQVAAMDAMVLVPPSGTGTGADGQGTTGESFSLTQNPALTSWPEKVQQTVADNFLTVSPNPTSGVINIKFDMQSSQLNSISVINILGEQVQQINTNSSQKDFYSIDLSGMSKGIYFVRCNFASEIITRKILLQ